MEMLRSRAMSLKLLDQCLEVLHFGCMVLKLLLENLLRVIKSSLELCNRGR